MFPVRHAMTFEGCHPAIVIAAVALPALVRLLLFFAIRDVLCARASPLLRCRCVVFAACRCRLPLRRRHAFALDRAIAPP